MTKFVTLTAIMTYDIKKFINLKKWLKLLRPRHNDITTKVVLCTWSLSW